MTDTPSSILLTREQSTGSNTNLWGGYLITTQRQTEQASKGTQTLAVTGDTTISWTNYTTGNTGQCAHLSLTGTLSAAATLTFPSYQNWMVVHNNTGATVTIKCSGGTGVSIPNLRRAPLHCNAVDYFIDAPTWTNESLTLTNAGDIVSNSQMTAAIAAASGLTAPFILVSVTDTTPGYLGGKVTLSVSGLTTTQVAGLQSLQLSIDTPGGNEKLKISAGQGYVGGFLNGGNKSAQFTPVVGTEYNCDFTSASWTVNLSGMTTPQVGQRIKLNCFGNFQPFLLGTVNSLTNLYLTAGTSSEMTYSSASWGWN